MTNTRWIHLWRGLRARHSPRRKSQLGPGLWTTHESGSDWLAEANVPPYIGSFRGSTTHACGYETVSTRIRSGGNRPIQVRCPARPPRLGYQSSRLGNQPTRLVAKPRWVRKGHPLWHSPLDKPGHPRPDLLKRTWVEMWTHGDKI